VVIEVKAVGINFPDTLIIEDKYQFKPARPFAPGAEVSGVVEAVGEGVKGNSRATASSPFPVGAVWSSGWPCPPPASSRCPTGCRSRRAPPSS
jgi:NADPH:quinone reductase-like Zn-dependent oxidoreductase